MCTAVGKRLHTLPSHPALGGPQGFIWGILTNKHTSIIKRKREEQRETDREKKTHTETDREKKTQRETDREKKKQRETDREKKKRREQTDSKERGRERKSWSRQRQRADLHKRRLHHQVCLAHLSPASSLQTQSPPGQWGCCSDGHSSVIHLHTHTHTHTHAYIATEQQGTQTQIHIWLNPASLTLSTSSTHVRK